MRLPSTKGTEVGGTDNTNFTGDHKKGLNDKPETSYRAPSEGLYRKQYP